jgi:hypothetical protein
MLRCLVLITAAIALSGCEHTLGNDEGMRYLQRSDTITFSAGDAKEVNARTQMLAAWPRGVNDRRIPANGARMVSRAMGPYQAGEASDNGSAGVAVPTFGQQPANGSAPPAR